MLLYVGSTTRLEPRWGEHRRYSDWSHLTSSRTVEWFDSVDEARAEEDRAIDHEKPIHNKRRPNKLVDWEGFVGGWGNGDESITYWENAKLGLGRGRVECYEPEY